MVCHWHQRFERCCRLGYRAALEFAAKVSGQSAEQLESSYREACDQGQVGIEEGPAEDEMEHEEDEPGEDSNECMQLLKTLQADAKIFSTDVEKESVKSHTEEDEQVEHNERELSGLFDKEHLKAMLMPEPAASEGIDSQGLPSTLSEALARPGDFFNNLWRLAVKLRSAPGGCDCQWIPNAENSRRAAKSLNWHQCLVCFISLMYAFPATRPAFCSKMVVITEFVKQNELFRSTSHDVSLKTYSIQTRAHVYDLV